MFKYGENIKLQNLNYFMSSIKVRDTVSEQFLQYIWVTIKFNSDVKI